MFGGTRVATYEFHCTSCDRHFTRLIPMKDAGRARVSCPACGSTKVERVVTSFYAKTVRKS